MRCITCLLLSFFLTSPTLASEAIIKQKTTVARLTMKFDITQHWVSTDSGFLMTPYNYFGLDGSLWVQDGLAYSMVALPESRDEMLSKLLLADVACGEMAKIATNSDSAPQRISRLLQNSIQSEKLEASEEFEGITYLSSFIEKNQKAILICAVKE